MLTAKKNDERETERYRVTLVPGPDLAANPLVRAYQMIRCGVPEWPGLWVEPTVAAGLRVLETLPRDTVIYGRALPGSSNVIGWHLARKTGRAWVAHFSDEWPSFDVLGNGRAWLAPHKYPLFELWRRRMLRDAPALTFTNPHQALEVLGSSARRYSGKSFVVTHLPSKRSMDVPAGQYKNFHVVHTGNFYSPAHSSRALIEGLAIFLERNPSARPHCRLTQAGWSNGDMPDWTRRCGLEDVVHFAGRLTGEQVQQAWAEASLLVGIDYPREASSTVLSKLPDYVNAGRPIMVITAPSSAMGRLFGDDGVGLTAHYDQPGQVAERLERVYEAWTRKTMSPFLPSNAAIESFTSKRVLQELAAAFVTAQQGVGATLAAPRPMTLSRANQTP